MVARLGDEARARRPGRPARRPTARSSTAAVEAAEGGGAPAEGELDRAQVDDAVADRVLAAERLEPVEQHGEVVVPAELGGDQGAVHVAGQDEERGQRPGLERPGLLVGGRGLVG